MWCRITLVFVTFEHHVCRYFARSIEFKLEKKNTYSISKLWYLYMDRMPRQKLRVPSDDHCELQGKNRNFGGRKWKERGRERKTEFIEILEVTDGGKCAQSVSAWQVGNQNFGLLGMNLQFRPVTYIFFQYRMIYRWNLLRTGPVNTGSLASSPLNTSCCLYLAK